MSDSTFASMPITGIDAVNWGESGLVPAIVQDAGTGDVLMLAYMSREALALCLSTGETHFWSRSRRTCGTRARRPATRSASLRSSSTATATRC